MAVVERAQIQNSECSQNYQRFSVFVSSSSPSTMSKTPSLPSLFSSSLPLIAAAVVEEVAAEVVAEEEAAAVENSRQLNYYFSASRSSPVDVLAWHFVEQLSFASPAAETETEKAVETETAEAVAPAQDPSAAAANQKLPLK